MYFTHEGKDVSRCGANGKWGGIKCVFMGDFCLSPALTRCISGKNSLYLTYYSLCLSLLDHTE